LIKSKIQLNMCNYFNRNYFGAYDMH